MEELLPVIIESLIVVIGGVVTKVLSDYLKSKNIEKEIYESLMEGVNKTHDTFVRQAKKSAEDGKLTEQEIEQAKALAISHAKQILTGPAKDALERYSATRLESLVRVIVKSL